jgi:hypothetical protein
MRWTNVIEAVLGGVLTILVVTIVGTIWNKRRNIIKWCKAKCKNIATKYKNIKAKIRKHLEKRVGIEDKNKEIDALKQQHKEELAKKDEEIEALEKTGRKHLADANTIIGSLYEPPQNAWDFLCALRNIEGVEGIFEKDCYKIIHKEFNNNEVFYILAKILHIGNGKNYGTHKGMLDATMRLPYNSILTINLTIEQILEEHKNNRETLTYEPPHLPTNHR